MVVMVTVEEVVLKLSFFSCIRSLSQFAVDRCVFRVEMKYDPNGRPYYVDHNTRMTSWTRPTPLPSGSDLRLSIVLSNQSRKETIVLMYRQYCSCGQSVTWHPGFDLLCHMWSALNCFRTSRCLCAVNPHMWGVASSDRCRCVMVQTVSLNVVTECPLTTLS